MASDESQIFVRFEPDAQSSAFAGHAQRFSFTQTPFQVPVESDVEALRSVLNSLIQDEDDEHSDIEFEFTVKLDDSEEVDDTEDDAVGEYMLHESTLAEMLKTKQWSTERRLCLVYSEPIKGEWSEGKPSKRLPDWVSSCQWMDNGFVLSGCYDGNVRVHQFESVGKGLIERYAVAHSKTRTPVKAVAHGPSEDDALCTVLSGGKDGVLKQWVFPRDGSAEPRCVQAFSGHDGAIESLAPFPKKPFNLAATGGADTRIRVWQLRSDVGAGGDENQDGEVHAKKKAKKGHSKTITDVPVQNSALQEYTGHSDCVSCIQWPSRSSFFSGGWDGTIRTWDVETATNTFTMSCGNTVYCAAANNGEASEYIASGHEDRCIRLWDFRSEKTLPVQRWRGHKHWVVGITWANTHQCLSASYDGTVKLWDLRRPGECVDTLYGADSASPLRMMDVDADRNREASHHAVACGQDNKLRLFHFS